MISYKIYGSLIKSIFRVFVFVLFFKKLQLGMYLSGNTFA